MMDSLADLDRPGAGQARMAITLCTYQGQRYLGDQLDSLAAQTRAPDELVVHDDASTDGSVEMVRAFAGRAPFPVRMVVNPRRLGSTANFENAIAAADADIIALCDQDDVWRPDKLARIEAAFDRSPEIGCVFSDADVVGESLEPLGYRLWQSVRLDARKLARMVTGAAVDVLLQQNVVTGATMALRAGLRDLILPIPPGWVQDGWIALLAAAVSGCLPLSDPLVCYRQHAQQQIGGLKRTLRQQMAAAHRMDSAFFRSLATNYQAARDRLGASRTHRCPEAVLAKLDGKIAHCLRRARIRGRRWHLELMAAELVSGRYRRYSLGWKSLASDLFL